MAVFGAQVEDVAHFDAALNGQHALAIGRGVARHHVADVGHQVRLRQVAAPVDAGHVEVFGVGTAHPIGQHSHFEVGHNFQGLLQLNRPQVAGLAAKVAVDFGRRGKAETAFHAWQFADFDFVHVMVTTKQQQPHL